MVLPCCGEMNSCGVISLEGINLCKEASTKTERRCIYFNFKITSIYLLCVGGHMPCTYALVCVWRSEGTLQDSLLSSFCVGPRTQVSRLGGMHLYPRSHLDGPGSVILNLCQAQNSPLESVVLWWKEANTNRECPAHQAPQSISSAS